MPDYYAVLDRKIQEANSDPAKVREVVYEAARLALRSQLHEQWPHLSIVESKRHLIELEDAIARMEANATSGSRRPQQATTRPPSEQNSITLDQGEAGAADTVRPDGAQPPETAAAEVAGLKAVAAVLAKTSQRGGARFDEPRPQVQNGHSAEPMTRDGHGHPPDFTHPTRAAAIENQPHDYPAASAQFAPTPADEHSAELVRVEVVDERGRRKMSKARRHSEPIRLDDASGLPEQHHSAELAQSETAAADSNWGSTREPEQSRSDRKPTINAGLHSDIDSHRQPYQRFTTELRSLENGGGDGLRESHRWQQFSRQRANWKASGRFERSSHPHDLDATSQVHNAPNERSEADDPSAPDTRYPTGPPVVERMKLPAPPGQDTNQREKGAARRLWARHGLQAQTERVDHLPQISDRPYQQDPFHREQPDWKGQGWINKPSEGRATARGVQGHFAGPESEAGEDPDTTPIRVQLPDQGAPRGNSSSPGRKRRTKSENNLANRDLRSAPIKPGESRAPDSEKDAYTHRWDSLPASDQEHEAQFRPADSDSEWGKKAHSQQWDSFLAPGEDDEIESRPTNSAADFASPTGSRELALIPNRAKRSTYIVTPNDFISPEVTYRLPPAPHSRARLVTFGLIVAFQLVIAALALLALYVSLWGHSGSVQTAQVLVPAANPSANGQPPFAPDRLVATASLGPTQASPALPFTPPATYGVYAVRDNQLIELEQVQTAPVDPRIRTQLQITKPARILIDGHRLDFVVFRRDLISAAPDKVQLRIAARIAQSMIFDTNGKPMVVKPPTDTWLIRERGWDLRVSPVRESGGMVILHTEDSDYSLSAGRYDGQAYDFSIAGEVTDPAHCVEGVATPRGPVFYECKRER